MKKINNRGFLLVETVIVSVFVLTIFVLIFQNIIPMIQEYNQRIRYDDVDTVYAIRLFRNLMLHDTKYDTFKTEVDAVGYKDMSDCSVFSPEQQAMCRALKTQLGIKDENRIYLTTWEMDSIISKNDVPRGFLEYIHYLRDQNQEKLTTYRLLISVSKSYVSYSFSEDGSDSVQTKVENRYANVGM